MEPPVVTVEREKDAERGVVTWRFPLLGFAMSIAVLCRLTDVFMAPFALYLAVVFWRRGLVTAALLVGYGLMASRTLDRMPSNTENFLFAWERERFAHTLSRTRPEEEETTAAEGDASRTRSADARPAAATPAPNK